jgi:hypothetical protein
VPRPYGLDDVGREVLEYLDGDTVGDAYPWPQWVWDEELLAQVGQNVAAFHRAAEDFRPPVPAQWQFHSTPPGPDEIIVHHDLAPYNVVAKAGRLQGFIDWDLAMPSTRLAELAFVAWEWVPLWHPSAARGLGWSSPPDLERRLAVLLDSYGLTRRAGFIDAVVGTVGDRALEITNRARAGVPGYAELVEEGQVANIERTLVFLQSNCDRLQALIAE